MYGSAVQRLSALLICCPPHVRPNAAERLAPFDQASQKPMFGSGTDRGSPEEFLRWATNRMHPAASPPPALPQDLEAAIVYVWRLGDNIADDREQRMCVVRAVSCDLEPLSRAICVMMSPAAVRIARAMQLNIMRRERPKAQLADIGDQLYCMHYGLWCAMLDAIQWVHRTLPRDLVHGFRSVGVIPDSGVWRLVDRPARIPFAEFAKSNNAWVYECRARVLSRARRDPEMAQACWMRTVEERDAGLIQGPFTISELNAPPGSGYPAFGFGRWRPLPRFAIWQGSKYRCIDDAAIARTNADGTSTSETIVCDRADSPLRIGLRFHDLGPPLTAPWRTVEMGGGTEDAFAAYRRAVTADEGYTTVMVAVPAGALAVDSELDIALFRVPGHNFGKVSAVLNFNCIPEPVVAFSRRALAVPVTQFYDDQGVHEPSYARGSGQSVHFELHELLRFHFDLGKHAPALAPVVIINETSAA